MQPVYIQRIASIHPQGNHSQGNNPKVNDSPDVSANRPFLLFSSWHPAKRFQNLVTGEHKSCYRCVFDELKLFVHQLY